MPTDKTKEKSIRKKADIKRMQAGIGEALDSLYVLANHLESYLVDLGEMYRRRNPPVTDEVIKWAAGKKSKLDSFAPKELKGGKRHGEKAGSN